MTPERNLTKTEALADWLRTHDDIAIVTHIMPDGDALGSALAVMHALHDMGKRAFVCDRDSVPGHLTMLPGWETVTSPDAIPFPPRAVLAVDCADEARMGTAGSLIAKDAPSAVIDHHETNNTSIQPALIDSGASASGVLVMDVLHALGADITPDIALCLYVAISTDTGNFSFSNTTPEALIAVSECLKAGLDLADMSFRLFRMKSAGRTRLLGRALNNIQYLEEGKIALIRLSLQDFAECGANDADTEGIVNYGLDTEGAEAAILAVERASTVKFSLRARSSSPINVAQLAARMGGGGHAKAAGVTLALPAEEAIGQVLSAFVEEVRKSRA